MSSAIGIGGRGGSDGWMMMQAMRSRGRPDPSKMAGELFSKLDTSGQGYLQKSDLEAAFSNVSDGLASSSSSSSNTAAADGLFSALDTDGDGKVTKQEFTDSLEKASEQFDKLFMSMHGGVPDDISGMEGMAGIGMPPPPPSGNGDQGFTKDELQNQLQEIGSSDSRRSSLISNIIDNFDKADTDGNGRVDFMEAMAYQKSTVSSDSELSSTNSSPSTTSSSSTSSQAASSMDQDASIMFRIMQLARAYMIPQEDAVSSLSMSA